MSLIKTHCHDDVCGSGGIDSRVLGVGIQGKCRLLRVLCTVCVKRTHRGEITFVYPSECFNSKTAGWICMRYDALYQEGYLKLALFDFLLSNKKTANDEHVRQDRHQRQARNSAAIANTTPQVTIATR
jgi:hypothetical protein